MRQATLVPFGLLCVLGILALGGCHRSASSLAPAGPSVTGPMNEKQRLEAEQWARITRGVAFDTKAALVEVEPVAVGTPETAREHLSAANDRFAENRIVDAMEGFVLAARHDPGLADAYVGMGVVLGRKGKHEQAIAALRTALDRDPGHADARYRLAMALWAISRQQDAIDEMNRLAEADASHGGAHERLAVWNYYAGEFATAWRHLHRARALGRPVPGQLASLLERHLPDPGPGAD